VTVCLFNFFRLPLALNGDVFKKKDFEKNLDEVKLLF